MVDNKSKYRIIAAMRKVFSYSELRKNFLKTHKYKKLIGKFKNGKDKFATLIKCCKCLESFKECEIQVDHIEPVVEPSVGFIDFDYYMLRLFCDVSNLQVLCKPCHKGKTKNENIKRTI